MSEQDAQVLPDAIDDNAPPPPIEIDTETGEVADAVTPPASAPAAPAAKAAIPRPQARIRELSDENRQYKGYASQLEAELKAAREEAAREKTEREKAERAGMENYASRVKSDLESATQELTRAEETNDVAGKVAAQTKLAKAAAAESDVDAWRATQPKPGAEPAAPVASPQTSQRPQAPQPQEQGLPEEVFQFVQENRWFDAVERNSDGTIQRDQRTGQPVGNPDFDEELHDAAMLIDKKIQRAIKRGDLPKGYAASAEYFQQIKDEMAAQFPELADGAQPAPAAPAARPRTPPMAPSRQPVAPAQRSGMPGQNNGARVGTKVTLSSEERQFVDGMVANGAMRYPRNHTDPAKRGQKMEPKDAYLEYAKRAADTRQTA